MYRAEFYKIMKTRGTKRLILLTMIASAVVALLPHYHSFDEIITGMGETAHVFTLFAAIMIATHENGKGTLKNVVSSGMKRSSIYYAKLKIAIVAAIFFYLIDAVITMIIGLVFFGYPISMGIPAILANVFFHLLIVVLGAMLYYAAASFIADPVWSVMACLAYFLFAAKALADVTKRFGLPIKLDSYVLGGIGSYDIMQSGPMEAIGIMVNVAIVLVIVLFVPVLMSKRDVR